MYVDKTVISFYRFPHIDTHNGKRNFEILRFVIPTFPKKYNRELINIFDR